MSDDQLAETRNRILLPWQVQRGTTVWAAMGATRWSAMEIRKPLRKKADGVRVKPHNGEETAKGKVRKDRLLKRDPKLKGKDKPAFTPEEVFAHLKDAEEEAKPKPKVAPVAEDEASDPKPSKPRKPFNLEQSWVDFYMKQGMSRADAQAAWDAQPTTDDW